MRGARLLLGRWVHLILGGALLTPFFLLAALVIPLVFDDVNPFNDFPWQFAAFAVALPLAALGALLFPLLRTLEATAARSLCGLPADVAAELTEEPADSWAARRRTALWFVAHLTAGGIVSGMTLAAPPAAVALLLLPVADPLRHEELGWPNLAGGLLGPLTGIGLLALVAGTTWAGGRLLARGAPALLGRTPADRLAAAERRAADLASRNRLARELHDSVGHALSAVTLQAGAARRVLDRDPEFVRQALTAIEETTRDAVAELDAVLGLLREDGDSRSTAPAPTLDDLDGLLARTRAAGLRITADVDDGCGRLPPLVSREAYRMVQEGLSNALRHAGAVPVGLRITVGAEELTITMENPVKEAVTQVEGDVATGRARPGGGRGLPGIAERARLLGGEARATGRDGVWRLTVRLPLEAAR
ncbi:histidine kinase [Streptomyces sp. NRRL F-5755]|uniref:sensor histidine kinase n=1 Tax=Streptomyces sp. NRRL F-5755 TaxID=1519475 RepID=UPI0006AE65F4|nr:histidine kinase [Streptomyces sp. NRRL F-5755]KOU01618.1 histidine kinase [Streptomyces sp. NRRL F-5755]